MDCEDNTHDPLESMLLDTNAEPKYLKLSLLEGITNHFNNDHMIGSGGFANVYKGLLKNGTVAIKKLSAAVDIEEKSFMQEVSCLKVVKHKNIVRFLGYCADTQGKVDKQEGKTIMIEVRQRLLCFEFMPNKSLDNHISDASTGLDWRTRYKIIKGICEGLDYLHQQNIVHLDLKPANILLDHSMVPKIADFGVSKIFDENQTHAMTRNVYASRGYTAPEFFGGLITLKADIYSLGTIIIEMLTGRKGCPEVENVLENWRTRFETSKEDTLLEHVRLCTEIGIECIESSPAKRPFTRHIIERLNEMDRRHGFIEIDLCSTSSEQQETRTSPKSRKPCVYRQLENVDALIDYVGKNLGYNAGKPVAAFIIYKYLSQWKSFEAERTKDFDCLIQLIGSAIKYEDDNDKLAYWLSNTTCLLFLLHRSLKPQQTSLFGTMTQGLRRTPFAKKHVAEATDVEAKDPPLLFANQLTAYVKNIYESVRYNIKKELSSPINSLSHSRTGPWPSGKSLQEGVSRVGFKPRHRTQTSNKGLANALFKKNASITIEKAVEYESNHWQRIIEVLDNLLRVLQDNDVTTVLTHNIFSQIFSYINVQLFNSLLLRPECCSFDNAHYLKVGLVDLEIWWREKATEYASSSWDELMHIRQAVDFLSIFDKSTISYHELVNERCPILSTQQLYRICTQYWNDNWYLPELSGITSHIEMRMAMFSTNVENISILLHDNSSMLFSVDDITNSIQKDFLSVRLDEELLDDPAFLFLHD